MPHYRTRTYSEDSEYESDEGTTYVPVKILGKGDYARARLFKSSSDDMVVVLNPLKLPGDIEEASIKQRFFATVYANKQSHLLFFEKEDYRLIVPYIPYVPYKDLIVDTPEFQKSIFRSALVALRECHAKGIIVIDLISDNICFDYETKTSYIIDGGLSAIIDTPVDPKAFQKPNKKSIKCFQKNFSHIPPECWTVQPNSAIASRKMDVYALGILMHDLLIDPAPEIKLLISDCLIKDPANRPTLEDLITSLDTDSLLTISP